MKKALLILYFSSLYSGVIAQSGQLDNSFGTGGIVITPITNFSVADDIIVQPDGKVLVCGSYVNGTSWFDLAIVRYNYDGTLDNTFGTAGIVTKTIGNGGDMFNAVALQNDGKIVVAGYTDNGSNDDIVLARFNSNGTPDNAFGTNGVVITQISDFDDFAYDIAIQPDGKIIIAGSYNGTSTGFNSTAAVVRYNNDGTLDNSFGTGGIVSTPVGSGHTHIYGIRLQPDGKMIIAGYTAIDNSFFFEDFLLVRYNSNGTLDNTFDGDGKLVFGTGNARNYFNTVVVYPDGKIAASGWIYNFGSGTYTFPVCRFLNNGSPDNSFGSNGMVITDPGSVDIANISEMALQPDNKIIIAGFFHSTPTDMSFVMYRYDEDGIPDNSFGVNGKVVTAITQSDQSRTMTIDGNRIYLAGYSSVFLGPVKFTVAAYKNCIAQAVVKDNIDTTICKGVPFLGTLIYNDTIYNDTLLSTCLYDSAINIYSIHILNADTLINRDTTVCYGSLYNNTIVYTSFTDKDTLVASTTCGDRLFIRTTAVTVTPGITRSFGKDSTLCKGSKIQLNAYSPALSYLWQDNSNGPGYLVREPGVYWVEITDTDNCKARDSITITLNDLYLDIITDTTILPQSSLVLAPNTNGMITWVYDPTLSCISCQTTTASPFVTTVYHLSSEKDGCSLQTSVKVNIEKDFYLYIPRAFTPNNDGLNDLFRIITNAPGSFLLEIYNRWGEVVFTTNNKDLGWNGLYKGIPQSAGTFIYVVRYHTKNGTAQKLAKGNLVLIR
jgi:uncharacterized delta-60 repeat protein/gliding motility-associated-like protein